MPQIDEPSDETSIDDFDDLPGFPGEPPKSDKWWNILKKLDPDAKIALSEARAHWAWKNHHFHSGFFKKRNVLAGELQILEDKLKLQHVLYLDRLAGAREGSQKSSREYREAATFLANAGRRYQKQSKHFTDMAMYRVQAQSAGRAEYPHATQLTTQPLATQSTSAILRTSLDEREQYRQNKYRSEQHSSNKSPPSAHKSPQT